MTKQVYAIQHQWPDGKTTVVPTIYTDAQMAMRVWRNLQDEGAATHHHYFILPLSLDESVFE